ncbi:MAG: phosphate signaling complex protein PhoU [Candidatus Marinimicrobia bacterium]|nr:phosphate signaling complex protein PhoU [Candidatus Neomarinimicrobiota bacterium]
MLSEKITELKRDIIEYGAHVENMIERSIKGLLTKDAVMLKEVMEKDEQRANDFDLQMDEQCIKAIAQFQPRARELRTILMILKMSNDFERLGDGAVNICKSALFLIERPAVKPLVDIPLMAQEAIGMLKDAINSFINEDAETAKVVCMRDNIVDDLRDKVIGELTNYMAKDPSTVERALQLIGITRNLERVADLSTNICEDVIFMVKGKSIKHHSEQ